MFPSSLQNKTKRNNNNGAFGAFVYDIQRDDARSATLIKLGDKLVAKSKWPTVDPFSPSSGFAEEDISRDHGRLVTKDDEHVFISEARGVVEFRQRSKNLESTIQNMRRVPFRPGRAVPSTFSNPPFEVEIDYSKKKKKIKKRKKKSQRAATALPGLKPKNANGVNRCHFCDLQSPDMSIFHDVNMKKVRMVHDSSKKHGVSLPSFKRVNLKSWNPSATEFVRICDNCNNLLCLDLQFVKVELGSIQKQRCYSSLGVRLSEKDLESKGYLLTEEETNIAPRSKSAMGSLQSGLYSTSPTRTLHTSAGGNRSRMTFQKMTKMLEMEEKKNEMKRRKAEEQKIKEEHDQLERERKQIESEKKKKEEREMKQIEEKIKARKEEERRKWEEARKQFAELQAELKREAQEKKEAEILEKQRVERELEMKMQEQHKLREMESMQEEMGTSPSSKSKLQVQRERRKQRLIEEDMARSAKRIQALEREKVKREEEEALERYQDEKEAQQERIQLRRDADEQMLGIAHKKMQERKAGQTGKNVAGDRSVPSSGRISVGGRVGGDASGSNQDISSPKVYMRNGKPHHRVGGGFIPIPETKRGTEESEAKENVVKERAVAERIVEQSRRRLINTEVDKQQHTEQISLKRHSGLQTANRPAKPTPAS